MSEELHDWIVEYYVKNPELLGHDSLEANVEWYNGDTRILNECDLLTFTDYYQISAYEIKSSDADCLMSKGWDQLKTRDKQLKFLGYKPELYLGYLVDEYMVFKQYEGDREFTIDMVFE